MTVWTRFKRVIVMALVISSVVLLTACGDTGDHYSQTEQSSAVGELDTAQDAAVSPSPTPELTGKDTMKADGTTDFDKYIAFLGLDLDVFETKAESMEDVPDNTIIVGAMTYEYEYIYDFIVGFNKAQNEYRAEVKRYENKDSMILDVVRGEGCDVLVLNGSTLNVLGNKAALEDLTPYFEKSEVVNKEDLFTNIWETGSVGDRMMGIKPFFGATGILVKKGTTNNGGWTLDDYIAFMESNTDIPVSKNAQEDDARKWFGNELSYVREVFVDWDARTCNFDNEEFINLIKKFKNYAQLYGYRGEMISLGEKVGEALAEGKYATAKQQFPKGKNLSFYLDLKTNMLDEYEFVGLPNLTGEAEYQCSDALEPLYCMNAASKKKDISWKLIEYMLSEECQIAIYNDNTMNKYPARRDILVQALQAEVEREPEGNNYYSFYTGEPVSGSVEDFTEADKEYILYILDHVGGCNSPEGDFAVIFNEEMSAFWTGGQKAEVTARNIQNRMSLLLME